MTLFHGSNREITGIDLEKCRPFKDFGKGFYTTPFQNQAWTMARRTVKICGNGTPWVTEFFFDENILKDDKDGALNIRRFDKPDNGLVRQPGWLSLKSCKILRILRFSVEVVRKLKFPNNSHVWALFVTNNRNRKFHDYQSPECNEDGKYDIVTGPVANDDIAALINTFLSGVISEDALRRELTFRELSVQYSFHTERAIALLRKTGASCVKTR